MKRWEIRNKFKIQNSKFKIEDIVNVLLENRGLDTKEKINEFLNPRIEDITFDSVGIDNEEVKKAIARIKQAIVKREKIIIYGDYDVDGITASAILWETLHKLGAKVLPYIPHRVDEGYGLSVKGIQNILAKKSDQDPRSDLGDVKLIITVDNGIVANEAVEFAKKNSIDVIITDHHTLGEKLPDAWAIVHTTKLCGAGIAWLFGQSIKYQVSSIKYDKNEDEHLELAALGTIADLVPLMGANRAIVKFGLEKLCQTKRPGLLELFQESGCDSSSIGVYEVGHIIAPRLNATGRMASAMDSLRLLCTKDKHKAESLASLLGTTNRERQSVMTDASRHAIEGIKYKISSIKHEDQKRVKKLLIAISENYPEGVIGLVAGRIVEEFYRPAIVISRGEKYSKGSVRSIAGFNIIEFLRESSDFFVNVGGHPMAAGFTIETDKIEQMQAALEKLAEAVDDGLFVRTLKVDCEIPLFIITDKFYQSLQKLSPFGMGNPEPTFASRNLNIEDIKVMGREGKHLRLTVSQSYKPHPDPLLRGEGISGAVFGAIAFGMGDKAADLHAGDTIDLAYTVSENRWNGNRKLELKVKDIKK